MATPLTLDEAKSQKQAARAFFNDKSMSGDSIMEAFTQHRKFGKVPRSYHELFEINASDRDLLGIAYLSRLYGEYDDDARYKLDPSGATIPDNEGARQKTRLQHFLGNPTDATIANGLTPGEQRNSAEFNKRNFGEQAMLEKKASLLLGRMYARYGDHNNRNGDKDKSLDKFIGKLADALENADISNPTDSLNTDPKLRVTHQPQFQLQLDMMQLASEKDIFSKGWATGLKSTIEDYIVWTDPRFRHLSNEDLKKVTTADKKDALEKSPLNKQFADVLKLIEENRKKHMYGRKVDSEALFKEIIGDPNALIFNMGNGFLIRSNDVFTCIGGSKEEWGQMAMMAMKYLQDRGDPWAGLVKIEGSPEFKNYIKAVFRQNSIRMKVTGHTETFKQNEINLDVIQNYRFNLGRGYAVVRTIKCEKPNEDGNAKVIFLKNDAGQDLGVQIPVYLKDDGISVTLNENDPRVKRVDVIDPATGQPKRNERGEKIQEPVVAKYLSVPVPEITEKMVHDSRRTLETDTPNPVMHTKNFDVRKYKNIEFPTEATKALVKSWETGRSNGPYCLCGSYTPTDPKSGRVPDETVYDSRLVEAKGLQDIDNLLEEAEQLGISLFALYSVAAENHANGQMAHALGVIPSAITDQQRAEYHLQQSVQRMAAQGRASTSDPDAADELTAAARDMRLNPDQRDFKKGDNVNKQAAVEGLQKSGASWSDEYRGTRGGGAKNYNANLEL